MTGPQRGLGRGLEALFSSGQDHQATQAAQPPQQIAIQQIEPNPLQPRKRFEQGRLQELAESIRQQGVLQPILVRPHPNSAESYQIIAGERRWRAASLAQLSAVPAIIQDITDTQSLIIGLVENLQREDLNPMEEAEALESLQQELQLSQEALAQKIGRSRPSITNSLRLLHLDPPIREAVHNESLSAGAARTLLGITHAETRLRLFEHSLGNDLSVRKMESIVTYWKKHDRLPDHVRGPQSAPSVPNEPSVFGQIKQRLVRQLTDHSNCRVSMSGTPDKGRITVSYRSASELRGFLERLGISADNVSRET